MTTSILVSVKNKNNEISNKHIFFHDLSIIPQNKQTWAQLIKDLNKLDPKETLVDILTF